MKWGTPYLLLFYDWLNRLLLRLAIIMIGYYYDWLNRYWSECVLFTRTFLIDAGISEAFQ